MNTDWFLSWSALLQGLVGGGWTTPALILTSITVPAIVMQPASRWFGIRRNSYKSLSHITGCIVEKITMLDVKKNTLVPTVQYLLWERYLRWTFANIFFTTTVVPSGLHKISWAKKEVNEIESLSCVFDHLWPWVWPRKERWLFLEFYTPCRPVV